MFTSMDTMITILIGLLSFVVGLIAFLLYVKIKSPQRYVRKNEENIATDNRLEGMTFVIAGKFSILMNQVAEALVTSLGGKISRKISIETTYVVAGTGAENQIATAQELGVPVITEDEFLKMVQ